MENKNKPYFFLLLDSDEDDYTLSKSLFHEAIGDLIKIEWFPRDGFANSMICSGIHAFTMVEYQIGQENGLEVIRKVKAECPDQVIF